MIDMSTNQSIIKTKIHFLIIDVTAGVTVAVVVDVGTTVV